MQVRRSTVLEAPAQRVWDLLLDPGTFRFIVAGMMGLDDTVLPDNVVEGSVVRLRVRPLHLPGGYEHEIRFVRLDPANREIVTEEHGGVIRHWHHRITVQALDQAHTRYTDTIDIDAGPLTPVVWAFARAFYQYRQGRWHKLVASAPLNSANEPS